MNSPMVPISWGELFDKITILQIKLENLNSKSALKNVKREHSQLFAIFDKYYVEDIVANELLVKLRQINQKLWNIEDSIRNKERVQLFDDQFIELARSVYFTNDERSRIKKTINNTFGSELVEEKSYSAY